MKAAGPLCYIRGMADPKTDKAVFAVVCPCCEATLWVDGGSRTVLRSEKAKKAKGSLDAALAKEQQRQGEFDRKFEATFELQKEKRGQADEMFRKALEKAGKGEGEAED